MTALGKSKEDIALEKDACWMVGNPRMDEPLKFLYAGLDRLQTTAAAAGMVGVGLVIQYASRHYGVDEELVKAIGTAGKIAVVAGALNGLAAYHMLRRGHEEAKETLEKSGYAKRIAESASEEKSPAANILVKMKAPAWDLEPEVVNQTKRAIKDELRVKRDFEAMALDQGKTVENPTPQDVAITVVSEQKLDIAMWLAKKMRSKAQKNDHDKNDEDSKSNKPKL